MSSKANISRFLARYSPEIAAQLRAARKHLAEHFPRGFELVYDNYNALVFGFSSSERASGAILSIAGYPKWVTLFFLHGATLADPAGILEGRGSQVRGVRLQPASRLAEPAVQALIRAAIDASSTELAAAPLLKTIVKSVSVKQRARKPAAKKKGVRALRARGK